METVYSYCSVWVRMLVLAPQTFAQPYSNRRYIRPNLTKMTAETKLLS